MGSSSSKFESLREKCNTIWNTLVDIKINIDKVNERTNLVRNLITQIKACRNEVDSLLKQNLNTQTNQNLRDIKEILGSDDFIDLNQSLPIGEIKVLLNSAIAHIKEVSNAIDEITTMNSFVAKLKSLWSVFGSFLSSGMGMIGGIAMKAIKFS